MSRAYTYEELRAEVVRICIKRDLGKPLTDREQEVLAYSVYAGQHGQNVFEGFYREDLTPEEEAREAPDNN